MRPVYASEITAWKRGNPIEDPTRLQFDLACEGSPKAEQLIRAGWESLGTWIRAQEKDIERGYRKAPELAKADPPTTGTTGLSRHYANDIEDLLGDGSGVQYLTGAQRSW